MQLIAVDQAKTDDLRYLVRSAFASKIYYVWTGRNAWWSTWSTSYSPGCFHTTLQSARSYCEKRRVQGTVFYIDEIAALSFQAQDRFLVATEINTEQFLGGLDQERLLSIAGVLPISSMTLRQINLLFRARSPLWPANYRWYNRMHISFGAGGAPPQPVSPDDLLVSHKSHAIGTGYSLSWKTRPFVKDRSVVHAVASAIQPPKPGQSE